MSFKIIILAGGKGTRISPVIGDTPKILAQVAGKTFLDWFLLWIENWKLNFNYEILLSTCVGHNKINDYCLRKNYNIECVREEKPLGTFGAVANVASKHYSKNYLVLNGDTIFKANFQEIFNIFIRQKKEVPLLILKESDINERYGGYEYNNGSWTFTNEKTKYISMGAFFISYESIKERWLNKTHINFDSLSINEKTFKEMMIDKDCFGENPINGYRLNIDTPFLDIGIPSSYNKSQTFIPNIIREMKMND